MPKKRVAIIGAGVSGCFLAHLLSSHKQASVIIFEKSRGVGGRCGVRRTNKYGNFNLGAQFFTNKHKELSPFFSELRNQSLIEPLNKKVGYLTDNLNIEAKDSKRYMGRPSMNSFLKVWTKDAEIMSGCQVSKLKFDCNQWSIISNQGHSYSNFDICILTLPRPQGKRLWQDHSQILIPKVAMHPCWALSLVSDPIKLQWPAAFIRSNHISWYSTALEQKRQLRWVVHASPKWSRDHLDDEPHLVEQNIIQELKKLLNVELNIQYAASHRWRYALSDTNPSSQTHLWEQDKQLGYTGDWFCNGRVEGAMLSAYKLYQKNLINA